MKYIVGDIGNTSTKISILNGKFEIKKSFNFETAKIYKKNFLKRILKNHLNKNLNSDLLFSSVVPAAFKEIKKIFKSTNFKLFLIFKNTFGTTLENKNTGFKSLKILFLIIVFIIWPLNIFIVSKLYDLKILKLLFKIHIFV